MVKHLAKNLVNQLAKNPSMPTMYKKTSSKEKQEQTTNKTQRHTYKKQLNATSTQPKRAIGAF